MKPLVLITGGDGLIGKKVIDQLTARYRCVGLDISADPHPNPAVEFINMDITSAESIDAALERVRHAYGSEVASVIHLAAYYDFSGEPSPLYDKVTVNGTRQLLFALQPFSVDQFLFSSTNLVYEPTEPGQKIDEQWPLNPTWNYPESKVKTEELLHTMRGHIPVTILRLAGAYDDEGHSIPITHQIQRIYEKKLTSYFYPGDLLHGNAFVHLDDLVEAIVLAVDKRHDLPQDTAFNISEPHTFGYEELQHEIGQLVHGKTWHTLEIPKPMAKFGAWVQDVVGDPFIKPWMIDRADDHYEMSITKAEQELGWHPRHNLKDTLPAIINNLKADPQSWYRQNKLST